MKSSALNLGCLALVLAAPSLSYADDATAATAPVANAPIVAKFQFNLPKAAQTSAAIYDENGKLVRTLWSLKPMTAGAQTGTWDGNNDLGQPLPAEGTYTYKVAASNETVNNVAAIGNTANPPTTAGHVPINFESVAVDSKGNAYTVHDWDEPHFDVIKWSAQTGQSVMTSGHVIGGLLKAVATDDAYVYTTTYENLSDRAKAKFYINRLKLNPDGMPLTPFTKAGNAIMVYDGGANYPAGASDADKGVMGMPLLSLAVHGNTLYATDSLAGKVHLYDKVSGEETGSIAVALPQSVAVAPDGRVWVAHEHSKVSVFDTDGNLLATPIEDAKEINAIAVHGNTLYVADQGAGQVKIYTVDGNAVTPARTFGDPARPGDAAAHRFYHLHGLAVDAQGNMITAQNEYFFNGGRLAKSDPTGKPLWEQLGLEFQSIGNYGTGDPTLFITAMHHAYRLDPAAGTWKYIGNTYDGSPYRNGITGVPRIVKLGKNDFYYMATGDGVQIYRIQAPADKFRGPVLKLSSIVGGNRPRSDGSVPAEPWKPETYELWTWHDTQGDNTVQPNEVLVNTRPEDHKPWWQYGPMTVDTKGNIWFTSADRGGETPERNTIYVIPLMGLDKLGNPIYDWSKVTPWSDKKTIPYETGIALVSPSGDGSAYVYGGTQKYPNAPQGGGVWMAGNVLMRMDAGQVVWSVVPANVMVGLEAVPGGAKGVLTGGDPWKGGVYHYSEDGLLLSKFYPAPRFGTAPNNPSGLLDMFAAISANRNPKDGLLDVFVEDDYNDRILWYRVDDRNVQTLTGAVTRL